MFLVDTNICSALLKGQGGVYPRFLQHLGRVSLPTVALGELYVWAYKRPDPTDLIASIEEELLILVNLVDYGHSAAKIFGQLRAETTKAGRVIDPVDLMIASVAIDRDLTLVTDNTKHFAGIPGLAIDNWLNP